ncbi:MAG: DUF4236 domain-containing protein [bacterium]
MGWRFRKSISLGKGLRMNLSKSGIGLSGGVKGMRVGVNSKGSYSTLGIPGTGIYSMTRHGSSAKGAPISSGKGCLTAILVFVGICVFVTAPPLALGMLAIWGIWYYSQSKKPEQQAIKKLDAARKFFNLGDYDAAIPILLEANALDKSNKNVLRMLGGALHNAGRYQEAISVLLDFLVIEPMDFDTHVVLANCFYQTEQYKHAIDVLQKLPDAYGATPKVIILLGASFAALKQYDLAINVFKKGPLQKRNLDDDLMELHYSLALIYKESGDRANALKHFKRVYAENVSYKDVAQNVEELEKK